MRVPGYFLTKKAPQLWLWRFRTATTLWSFKVPSLIDLIIMTDVYVRISLEKLVFQVWCAKYQTNFSAVVFWFNWKENSYSSFFFFWKFQGPVQLHVHESPSSIQLENYAYEHLTSDCTVTCCTTNKTNRWQRQLTMEPVVTRDINRTCPMPHDPQFCRKWFLVLLRNAHFGSKYLKLRTSFPIFFFIFAKSMLTFLPTLKHCVPRTQIPQILCYTKSLW